MSLTLVFIATWHYQNTDRRIDYVVYWSDLFWHNKKKNRKSKKKIGRKKEEMGNRTWNYNTEKLNTEIKKIRYLHLWIY